MHREDTSQVHAESSTSIRKILKESHLEEWADLLESNGVVTLCDLRRVKYTDLVQYGITEFEPRKRLFELIKRTNLRLPSEPPVQKTPLQSRIKDVSKLSLGFSFIDKDSFQEKLVQTETETEAGANGLCEERLSVGRVSVLKEGYSPQKAQWKRKKEMVSEIMEEAENSIVESSRSSIVEDSCLPSTGEPSTFSDNWAHSEEASPQCLEQPGRAGHAEPKEDLGRIKVVVRKRPIRSGAGRDVISIDGVRVVLTERKQKVDLTPYMEPHTFVFDNAFNEVQTTADLYTASVRGLVEHALQGGSSTCLAYGQTGSGKTFTMLEENTGVILLALKDLLAGPVQLSFYEIYLNHIYDLFDERKRIFAREKDGIVSIMGIKERTVRTLQEARHAIREGLMSRMTGRTGANANSSRSHALLRVRTETGLFTFVDLAGSERGSERGGEHTLKREGAEINKSLLALKECIRAMDQSASHLPFRHSKLTQVLKESLIGNSKCCIIATVSPEEPSAEHTLNTLRYAFRIREIGVRNERRESVEESCLRTQGAYPPRKASPDSLERKETLYTGQSHAYAKFSEPISPSHSSSLPPAHSSSLPPAHYMHIQQGSQKSSQQHSSKPFPTSQSSQSSQSYKYEVQQALAEVAARISRETDPEALETLKRGLLHLASYSNK
ncbi:kinesin family member 2/24 [Nematocida sp. AWRm77]|nr:kinesin family member 2/24 [Nematocida sp. AWRm77]